jgi:hypothetical protein
VSSRWRQSYQYRGQMTLAAGRYQKSFELPFLEVVEQTNKRA